MYVLQINILHTIKGLFQTKRKKTNGNALVVHGYFNSDCFKKILYFVKGFIE